jgi:hypothetical protein
VTKPTDQISPPGSPRADWLSDEVVADLFQKAYYLCSVDQLKALTSEILTRRAGDLTRDEQRDLIQAATGGPLTAAGEKALDKLVAVGQP